MSAADKWEACIRLASAVRHLADRSAVKSFRGGVTRERWTDAQDQAAALLLTLKFYEVREERT